MKILCWLGLHDDDYESVRVAGDKFWQTSNNRWVCKRCGRKTEWTGSTTFGPIKFRLEDDTTK